MKVVAIGGGHGAAATLRAALTYADEIGAIITVADDGGSSGRLAAELGVLPMGDIRNCLAALAPASPAVDVFQHRFKGGRFDGHVVGNLMIAAATTETGSFITAIDQAAASLGSRGKVVPPTLEPIRLISDSADGGVEGQVAVATMTERIERVRIEPSDPKAYAGALDLLSSADQIILGPGSLFTSVLPPLLVPGVAEAFRDAKGLKIYICNLVAPPGETSGFTASAHLRALIDHVGPRCVDVMVMHSGRPPRTKVPRVDIDSEALEPMQVRLVWADMLPPDGAPRHDPSALAAVLARL